VAATDIRLVVTVSSRTGAALALPAIEVLLLLLLLLR
jgi:hypothetical protein